MLTSFQQSALGSHLFLLSEPNLCHWNEQKSLALGCVHVAQEMAGILTLL